MANNGEFIDLVSGETVKQIKEIVALINQGADGVVRLNSEFAKVKTPSGNKAVLGGINAEMQKSTAIIERQRLAQLKLDKDREKAFDRYDAQLKKEEQSLARNQTAYNRYQASLNLLINEYKDLAIRKELGNTLSKQEEIQMDSLIKRINLYDAALKKVDASMGRHQREVGNYAKGNSNLSNSIGQISRELPNFGQSFSIGVLSLTNNIGALIDSIKQVKAQNAELKAQGQGTKSIFSQILSSILSWQTALFIGIGIFSAYSKEIGTFVKDLFSANEAIKANERAIIEAYEARMRYDFATADASKSTRKEIDSYLNLTAVMKDGNKSYDERLNAAKRIKDAYPGYLKNFTEEQILAYQSGKANKELSKTINQLAADITKRNLAESQAGEANKTYSNLADLKEEFKYREAINKQVNSPNFSTRELYKKRAEERADLMNDSDDFIAKFGKITIDEFGQYSKSEINALKIRYNALVREFNKERSSINKKLVETSLLDYKPEKEDQANKIKTEKLKDYIANEYALNRLRIANQSAIEKAISIDESVNFERREQAVERYLLNQRKIAEMDLAEKLRLIKLNAENEIQSLNERVKKEEITRKNANAVIATIQKQGEIDSLKSYEEYANDLRTISNETEEKLKGVWNALNFKKAEILIDTRSLDEAEKYLETLGKITNYRDFDKLVKNYEQSTKGITSAKLQLELDVLNADLRAIKDDEANVKKRLDIQDLIIKKEKEVTDAKIKEAEKRQEEAKKEQQAIEAYLKTFQDDFIKNTGFDTLFKIIGKEIKGFGEDFAVTFNAITEVAQEAFKFLNQSQDSYFDRQYERLAKEKEIAIMFAGDSATAKEEIERQYEERRREIDRRKARAAKDTAIFNAIIDTAQAVVAFLAEANYAGAILAGVIGAAQIAIISNTQVPAYAMGTENHAGGLAWVGDGGKHEVVYQPSKGFSVTPKNDTLVDLEKGSKVYPDMNSFLKNSGSLLGGIPNIQLENSGMTEGQMDAIMGKYFSQITTQHTTIDKDGFNTFVERKNSKMKLMNNRTQGKGFSV